MRDDGWNLLDQPRRTPPKPPTPEQVAAAKAEKERTNRALAERRRELRQKLAEARAKETRLAELDAEIKSIDYRREAAVAEHAATTGPIQTQLAGEATQEVRAELRKQLRAANSELQTAIDELDRELADLQRSRYELALQCNGSTYELQLHAISSPEFTAEIGALRRVSLWIQRKVDFISEQMAGRRDVAAEADIAVLNKIGAVVETRLHDLEREAVEV